MIIIYQHEINKRDQLLHVLILCFIEKKPQVQLKGDALIKDQLVMEFACYDENLKYFFFNNFLIFKKKKKKCN